MASGRLITGSASWLVTALVTRSRSNLRSVELQQTHQRELSQMTFVCNRRFRGMVQSPVELPERQVRSAPQRWFRAPITRSPHPARRIGLWSALPITTSAPSSLPMPLWALAQEPQLGSTKLLSIAWGLWGLWDQLPVLSRCSFSPTSIQASGPLVRKWAPVAHGCRWPLGALGLPASIAFKW